MPLTYGPETPWPPQDVKDAAPHYVTWSAWFRGDTTELHRLYSAIGANYGGPQYYRPHSDRGLRSALGRFWWGRPITSGGQTRLHVPAAKDVATLGADQLFADPPALEIPEAVDGGQQQRLDDLLNDGGVYAALHKAAVLAGAYGGVYLRATANAAIADGPIVDVICPDTAAPEFYGPWLQAVTFWTVISSPQASQTVRHLERHEMRQGKCVIYHAVYAGGPDKLGRPVPLTDYPETERFALLVDDTGMIEVGTSRLDVVYVPNMQPHLELPHLQLGRADYSGSEQELDGIDETWTSLMRDIRLGKGRVFVPRSYVSRMSGDGAGGFWDPEREVYAQLSTMAGSDGSAQLALTAQQFAIRVDEHLATANGLWKIILRNAGMDGNEQDETVAPETATSVKGKQSRKRGTRAVKIRYWTPQLRRLGFVLQELLQLYWHAPGAPTPPDVEWPDASAPDMETMAQTLQLLDAAGAVSTRTKVEMLHPEWSEDQVNEEVRLIESAAAPPDTADPGDLGAPGAGDGLGEEQATGAPLAEEFELEGAPT